MEDFKKRSRKKGLPPGTLVYIGEKRGDGVRISVIDYDSETLREKEAVHVEECFPFKMEKSTTWINVDGLHKKEILECLGKNYDLHPLTLEDIMNTHQRPKVEDFGNYLYIVLKMIYLHPGDSTIITEQVSLILGENFVMTFQEREGDVFDPIRQRIKEGKGSVRKMHADYLAYCLIDSIVDNYFSILERYDEQIDNLEDQLLGVPANSLLNRIYAIKREVISLRKAVWPLREVVSLLERLETRLIEKKTRAYLRDIYDHAIQVVDTVDTYREIISGMHDLYLSNVSNRMNEIMKILTIIATIFIPITFIAGIYGMNFEFMPEIHWKLGYPVVWGIMITMAALMLAYFRKNDWL
ncbi:magnesium/cobalt transporter CorA [Candidatus Sumerlaeota bacterium]|nr:magnesium/cobalt transporter CorA [Candidatus Sumerlaeota bacterium]